MSCMFIYCTDIKAPHRPLVKDYLYVHNSHMETKRPRGRPPIDDPEDERYELRLSRDRRARYEAAAAKAGKALAAWIKAVLDRSSKR
jgi:hypothetical protein